MAIIKPGKMGHGKSWNRVFTETRASDDLLERLQESERQRHARDKRAPKKIARLPKYR